MIISKKRITLFLLMLSVMILATFTCMKKVQAEENGDIGTITVDGNTKTYSSLESLAGDLEGYENKTVTIDMLSDWIAIGDKSTVSDRDRRLYIPEKCKCTFNMHGYQFNRCNSDDASADSADGELIYVENEATLTINGGDAGDEKGRVHKDIRYFSDTKQDTARNSMDVQGGCLADGNSNGGTGGIYIDSGKEVILNDVTIVGCKASTGGWFVSHSGPGAGIIITEPSTKLTLNNSRITGCLAEDDGGAIYGSDVDDVSIELHNSSIDHNYANSDGGGINLDGQNLSIKGFDGSVIFGNKCEEIGGGVYFWNDEVKLTADNFGDLTIDSNRANLGGGVYVTEENNELTKLIITNNNANKGGGVYVGNDYTTIDNCTITGNKKYGVYVEDHCDAEMYLKGSSVIKDNDGGNLTLYDGTSFFACDQNENMDIHIGYVNNPTDSDGYKITKNITVDISNQFTADDDNFVVTYPYRDTDKNDGRHLYYIKKSDEGGKRGRHRVNPEISEISTQDIHAYTEQMDVYAGGYTKDEGGSGTRYEMRQVFGHHSSNHDRDFPLYYTDGFFFEDPVIYNDHLATASSGLATAGAYLDEYAYNYKHAGTRQFLADIGCPDQMIYVNDNNESKPGTDTIGVTIGSKVLQQYDGSTNKLKDTDSVLVVVTVRGANYENEWASNVTLGDGSKASGEAQGFSEAADQTMEAIEYYIARYDLQDEIEAGKVKFWVSGFSRAGATSNITSKRLIEKYCVDTGTDYTVATGNEVFAYPVEPPRGGTDNAELLSGSDYYSIHNLVNTCDVVPLVGPREMGFKRYGVDHYMPGTHIGKVTKDEYLSQIYTSTYTPERASAESGVTKITTYSDNRPLDTKKDMNGGETTTYREYADRRDNMVMHLATLDHSMLFMDYFYPFGTGADWPPYNEEGDYDGAKLEDYLPNLLAFAQQEACDNRDNYAVRPVVIGDQTYPPLQQFARDYYSAEGKGKDKYDALVKAFKIVWDDGIWSKAEILAVVGNYYTLSDNTKLGFIEDLWNTADEDQAFKDMTAAEKAVIHKYWYTIVDTAFNFADGDWHLGADNTGQGSPTYPTGVQWVNGDVGSAYSTWLFDRMVYSLTIMQYADSIIDVNHDRKVCLAWARTYDSYYSKNTDTGEIKDDQFVEYSAHWVKDKYNPDNYSVDKPGAYVKFENADQDETNSPYKQLVETTDKYDIKYNELKANQKVLLEVGKFYESASPANVTQGKDDVLGEAIYYKLYDISDGEGGGDEPDEELYRGGIDLPVGEDGGGAFKIVAHAISLGKASEDVVYYIHIGHKVTVDDGSGNDPVTDYYSSGETVTISAMPSDDKFFANWKVKLLDENGEVVEFDITDALLGEKKGDSIATFTMPNDGDEYAPGKTYPDKYGLEIEAECFFRIYKIYPQSAEGDNQLVPVAGVNNRLAATSDMSFVDEVAPWTSPNNPYSVSWTYSYNGEERVASTDEPIYGGCVYTATINIPKDQPQYIVFASELTADYMPELKDTYTSMTAVRDESDGSATVTIVFKETGVGPEPPMATNLLKLRGVDITDPQTHTVDLGDYGYVYQNMTVLLTAKSWTGYRFVGWAFDEIYSDPYVELADEYQDPSSKTIKVKIKDNIPTDHQDVCLYAKYKPIVTDIAAVVEAPVGGQLIQMDPSDEAGQETLKIKLGDEWFIVHPDYINTVSGKGQIDWSPNPMISADGRKAAYLIKYTAGLHIVPKEDHELSYIEVKREGTDSYFRINADFLYSEKPTATMNDDTAAFDANKNTLSYTFPMTKYKLVKVFWPEDVTGVPYGTEGNDIKKYLPTIKILLDDGKTMTTVAAWGTPEKEFDSLDEYSSHIWVADGVVQLPYGVENPDNVSLDVIGKVVVDAAKCVERPIPSVDPGEYLYDQRLTLSSETEGAIIYWTTDPDATDNIREVQSDPKWHKYEGLMIGINRANATEDEIGPDGKPTGRKLIKLRLAAFKDGMRQDGVRTYVYIFVNEVPVPEGRDYTYDGKPHVGVASSKFYTLEAISEGVEINSDGEAVAVEPGTYKVRAKIIDGFKWKIVDPETGEITYTTEDQIITFTITKEDPGPDPPGPEPGKQCTITYDLNGGVLDGKTGTVTASYDEGTVIKLPRPSREGYTFKYWKGSEYQAGQEYKVVEDHTFTAQWQKVGPSGPDTGDDFGLKLWIILMAVSLLSIAGIIVLKRNL